MDIFYFSNVTNNTARFVESLDVNNFKYRIDIKKPELALANRPFMLVVPTYGDHQGKGMVPHQVKTFLDLESNAKLLRGVITAGNRNFGKDYGMAGKIISHRFNVPLLYTFEIAGTAEDKKNVSKIIQEMTKQEEDILI